MQTVLGYRRQPQMRGCGLPRLSQNPDTNSPLFSFRRLDPGSGRKLPADMTWRPRKSWCFYHSNLVLRIGNFVSWGPLRQWAWCPEQSKRAKCRACRAGLSVKEYCATCSAASNATRHCSTCGSDKKDRAFKKRQARDWADGILPKQLVNQI